MNPTQSEIGAEAADQEQIIKKNMIRLVLAKDSKSQLIRREHLVQLYSGRKYNFERLFDALRKELNETYGLDLVSVQQRTGSREPNSKSRQKQAWVLENILHDRSKLLMRELFEEEAVKSVDNGRLQEDTFYFIPRYQSSETPFSNVELLRTGILSVILTVLIISENHLSDKQLYILLKEFGLDNDSDHINSNLGMSLPDIINDFVKKDYLEQDETKESNGVSHIEYRMGIRTLLEFPPKSVYSFMSSICGSSFDSMLKEKAIITINNAYGTDFKAEDTTEPMGNSGNSTHVEASALSTNEDAILN